MNEDSTVRPEDLAPPRLRYELAPEQQKAYDEFRSCGSVGVYWSPGSGKRYFDHQAMTTIRGQHRLFVHSDTIRDGWIEHFRRYAPFVKVEILTKPTRLWQNCCIMFFVKHKEVTAKESICGF